MFKINFYPLFFFVLFFNSSNVHVFSFNWDPIDAINIFPNTNSPSPESGVGIHSLFPIDGSITPQPYNSHFNNSTHTLVASSLENLQYLRNAHFFMNGQEVLHNFDYSNSTDIFNINYFSLPIAHVSEDFNDAFANTSSSPLLITDESTSYNITDIPAHTNNSSIPSVMPHTQQQKKIQSDEGKDHVLAEKKKKKREKKKKKDEKRAKKTYTCSTCNKTLASRASFNYHLKTHDLNRPRPYECNICHKSFAEKFILKAHHRTHKDKKPFKCKFCKKRFETKQRRVIHHRSHTGEKPFKCKICGKCYSTKTNLKRHENNHTGEKPFKCHLCQKGLSCKSALEDHLNKHKSKKPYKCNLCAKAYTSKSGLKCHVKTHSRPKPYSCHYCDVSFFDKSEYKNHVRYEEETDDDLKCHRCKKAYSSKYCLSKHNKKTHPTNS